MTAIARSSPSLPRRVILAPVVAAVLASPTAGVAAPTPPPPSGCAVLADQPRDVALTPTHDVQRVDEDGHLDLTGVRVGTDKGGLAVTVAVRELVPTRPGTWTVTFTTFSPTRLFVQASALPSAGPAAPTGWTFRAGVVGKPPALATGGYDAGDSAVRIVAPLSAFGGLVTSRDYLVNFAVEAEHRLVDAPPAPRVRLFDTGDGDVGYGLAGVCGIREIRTATNGPGCLVVVDPAGDVEVEGVPGSDRIDDRHLDVRGVEVWTVKGRLAVWIDVRALDPRRPGTWTVTFSVGKRRMFVQAVAALAPGAAPLTYAYRAGLVGTAGKAATGRVGEAKGELRIDAPLSAFGGAVTGRSVLRTFSAEAEHVAATVPAHRVRLRDIATSTGGDSYRMGGGCPSRPFGFIVLA